MKEYAAGHRRREHIHARLANYVRLGHEYVVLEAAPTIAGLHELGDCVPYVQCAWLDDLRLIVETQGTHYRGIPYCESKLRILRDLGYADPCELAADNLNFAQIRTGEGTQPESIATLMLDTLRFVHPVHFEGFHVALRHGTCSWRFTWTVSPKKYDIEAEFRKRMLLSQQKSE